MQCTYLLCVQRFCSRAVSLLLQLEKEYATLLCGTREVLLCGTDVPELRAMELPAVDDDDYPRGGS